MLINISPIFLRTLSFIFLLDEKIYSQCFKLYFYQFQNVGANIISNIFLNIPNLMTDENKFQHSDTSLLRNKILFLCYGCLKSDSSS